MQHGALPFGARWVGGRRRCPDADRFVLGGGCDVGFLEHGGGPGDVADPVRVAGEVLRGGVGVFVAAGGVRRRYQHIKNIPTGFFNGLWTKWKGGRGGRGYILPIPNLNHTITAARRKPSLRAHLGLTAHQTAGHHRGRPTHGVDAHLVRGELDVAPVALVELEDRDIAVGGGAGEEAAAFVRGPGDDVDGGVVVGEIGDFGPEAGLFAPDEDFAVVGGGGEDVAVFGVGLWGFRGRVLD